jgi:hypothetical protein
MFCSISLNPTGASNDSTKICWGDVTAFAVDKQLVLAENPKGAVNY